MARTLLNKIRHKRTGKASKARSIKQSQRSAAERIEAIMASGPYSQSEVASMLGISRGSVCQILADRGRVPLARTLRKLAEVERTIQVAA